MELTKDYQEFFELLNANGVRYLVIGGFAVALHGHPRYTKDLDIWLWINEGNAEKLRISLKQFGFGSLGFTVEDFLNPEMVFQLGYEPNRIDLINSIDGLDFDVCYAKRVVLDYKGVAINFIDISHLIESKLLAGRLQDLADVEMLRKIEAKRNQGKV